MRKSGVAFVVVVACFALVALALPARAQCSYGSYEIVYAQPISGNSNLFVSCGTSLQTTNVSAILGVYTSSSSQFTGWTISSSQFGIAFQGPGGHLLEALYTAGTGWTEADLTAAAGGTAAVLGTPLGSFTDGHGQHVFYFGTDGSVHQMLYSGSSWANQTLAAAGSIYSESKLAAYEYNSTEFVVYEGSGGDVRLLSFNGSSWTNTNLTTATGGEVPMNGTAFTGIDSVSPNSAQLIYFVGADGNVHEYSEVDGQWSDHAVVVSGLPKPAPNGQLVFYVVDEGGATYDYYVSYLTGPYSYDGADGFEIFAAYRPDDTYSWNAIDVTTQGGEPNPTALNVTLGGVSTGIPDYVYFSGNQAGSTPPPSVTLLIPSDGLWHATSSALLSSYDIAEGTVVVPLASFQWLGS